MKKILVAAILAGSVNANALISGGSTEGFFDCGSSNILECALLTVVSVSSIPTLLLGADGAAQMNPQVLEAVQVVLSSDRATSEQKQIAKSALETMANDLVQHSKK